MKFNKNILATAVACGALALTPLANAADGGEITFEGEVKEVSCTIEVDGQTEDATVTLNPVYINEFDLEFDPAGGSIAETTGFTVEFSDCSANVLTSAQMQFEPTNFDADTGNLLNVGGDATGVELLLTNAGGVLLDELKTAVISFDHADAGVGFESATSTASIGLEVSYIATTNRADITPGTVESSATYTVIYD